LGAGGANRRENTPRPFSPARFAFETPCLASPSPIQALERFRADRNRLTRQSGEFGQSLSRQARFDWTLVETTVVR
jgi:hypothetical protein